MKEETNSGWVKLHRSILRWEWWTEPLTAHFFTYCLLKANREPKEWHGITIERGAFITSRAKVAAETGLSERQVRTAIERLVETGEIKFETQQKKHTKITVLNMDKYQKKRPTNPPINDQENDQENDQPKTAPIEGKPQNHDQENDQENRQQTTKKTTITKEEKEIENNLFYDDDARAREENFFKEKEIGEIYKELLPIYNSETETTNAIRMKVRRDYDITLTPEQVGLYFTKFFETQVAGGIQTANRKDYCLHFASWLYKRIEAAQKKKETQTPKKPALNPRLEVTKGSNKGMTADF